MDEETRFDLAILTAIVTGLCLFDVIVIADMLGWI